MILEGDEVAFESSVKDNEETVLFNEKKYVFITDATSNQGSFSSGQIQFVLDTLHSQSDWISLKEAVVEFPVKITAQLTTAGASTHAGNSTGNALSVINKNGFHQWIDGAQLIINGQTIQSLQPYENVAAQFRIISDWSRDNLTKWGTTCGIAFDDCTGDGTNTNATGDITGLGNATYSTVATSVQGYDCVNNQTILANRGTVQRAKNINTAIKAGTVSNQILGAAGVINAGISHVAGAASNTVNTYLYTQFIMATVRIKDLFDIEEFPLVKNVKGFLYLNFNSFQTVLTGNTSTSNGISAVTYTPLTGRSNPYMINLDGTSGLDICYASTAAVITVIGTINGTSTNAISPSGPLLTQARLVVPKLMANPRADEMLIKKAHKFSTLEKIINPITLSASASTNYTITVGVPNPRKLVLLPMWQNLGGVTNLGAPEYSAFDSVPASSGPYCYLNQLQVYLANKPLFQYPINYDFEMWNAEISEEGANGKETDELTSGLLTQELWQQNHRYYYIDLSRRLESEDGSAKSVIVSFNNPSANFGMKVIAIVFYEKKWSIDTENCYITSA